MPSKTPEHPPTWAPTQPPIIPPSSTSSTSLHQPQTSIHFSPPLVAMVVIAAAAFLLVAYSSFISHHLFSPLRRTMRRFRHWKFTRRHSEFPASDTESFPPHHQYDSSDGFYVYSPYGLDDTVINNIPLTIYKNSRANSKLEVYELDDMHDCAVCLLELEDGDYMRTLPHCFHSFHADCIDTWLRAHATCPICRAGMSPMMMPIMAARIRPSLDEGVLLESVFLAPLLEQNSGEIQPEFSPDRRRDFLLKRSYSFSFERSFATSERVMLGAATTPHRHHHQRRRSFWARRPSSTTPFNSIAKSRVSKFRNYRGTILTTKSPGFFRRRSFFPMSESSASMRWLKSAPSPMFGRAGLFSSSRMRLGDPEALISPERYER